jgi:hypothetical protein
MAATALIKRTVAAVALRTVRFSRWQSVANRRYFLQCSSNATGPFALVVTNVIGVAGTTIYNDSGDRGSARFFYRVGVRE